jgi:hypothetical protein
MATIVSTYYWFELFARTTVSVSPDRNAASGAGPPWSNQLIPMGALFTFVEAFDPLKYCSKLISEPPNFPGLKIPVISDETLESFDPPSKARLTTFWMNFSCVSLVFAPYFAWA